MPVQRVDDIGPQRGDLRLGKEVLFLADLLLRLRHWCAVIQLFELSRQQVNFLEVATGLCVLTGELDQSCINGRRDALDRRRAVPFVTLFP